ncbi:MAG: hypothetical protein HRT47_13825 [Candidatus Caenarcaniphilales bacterium]|nr:hypothetical protein [Candidatus Caenarcaniphilales bacterium]
MSKIVPQNRQQMIEQMQARINQDTEARKKANVPTEVESLRTQLKTSDISTGQLKKEAAETMNNDKTVETNKPQPTRGDFTKLSKMPVDE